MTIAGTDIPHFSDVKIRYEVSGYGEKGVISVQLTFSVPSGEYPDSAGAFPAGSLVIIEGGDIFFDVPGFYVISRNVSKDRITFTCSDRTLTTDRQIGLEERDFDEDGYISIYELTSHIAMICDYEGVGGISSTLVSAVPKVSKDNILGRKCRDVLDDLSAVCAGVWTIQGGKVPPGQRSGTLALVPLGGHYNSDITPESYEKPLFGGQRKFEKIVMSDGGQSFTAGASGSVFGTMEINSPFASAQAAGELYQRLRTYTYQAWSCDNMRIRNYPAPMAQVTLGERKLIANRCTLTLTATGVYASMGSNDVSEDEVGYLNRTRREMLLRYRLGDTMANVKITPQDGIRFVVRDNVNDKTENYGFKVSAGGTTDYDGAMIDKKMPARIEKVSDTERKIIYDGVTYHLSYDDDGSGNKSNIKLEKIENE